MKLLVELWRLWRPSRTFSHSHSLTLSLARSLALPHVRCVVSHSTRIIYRFIHCAHSFTLSLTLSLTYYSLTHLLTYSLTHLLIHSLSVRCTVTQQVERIDITPLTLPHSHTPSLPHSLTHTHTHTTTMTFLISPLLLLYFIFCMCVSATALEGNYFDAIEKMFIAEEGRQATNVLQEDLASGYDSPKEVSVTYNTVRV